MDSTVGSVRSFNAPRYSPRALVLLHRTVLASATAITGRHALGEVSGAPRQRLSDARAVLAYSREVATALSDARAVLAYSREVATAPPGANGTPMTGIPFEAATP